jgi:hypothetical protein
MGDAMSSMCGGARKEPEKTTEDKARDAAKTAVDDPAAAKKAAEALAKEEAKKAIDNPAAAAAKLKSFKK